MTWEMPVPVPWMSIAWYGCHTLKYLTLSLLSLPSLDNCWSLVFQSTLSLSPLTPSSSLRYVYSALGYSVPTVHNGVTRIPSVGDAPSHPSTRHPSVASTRLPSVGEESTHPLLVADEAVREQLLTPNEWRIWVNRIRPALHTEILPKRIALLIKLDISIQMFGSCSVEHILRYPRLKKTSTVLLVMSMGNNKLM